MSKYTYAKNDLSNINNNDFLSKFNETGVSNSFANAIKGKASGTIVCVDDASPIEHNLTVKVRSKNLIAYPYKYSTLTTGGVTFTVGENGGVTASGTASSAFFPLEGGWGNTDTLIPDWLEVGKTYTITDAILLLTNRLEGKAQLILRGTFVMPEGYRTYGIFIYPEDGETLENKVYYPQLEEGAVAPEYIPYVAPSTVTLTRCGKNLFNIDKTDGSGYGLTLTKNADGTHTLSGTLTQTYNYTNRTNLFIPAGTTVTVSSYFECEKTAYVGLVLCGTDGSVLFQGNSMTNGSSKTITLTKDVASVGYVWRVDTNSVAVGDTLTIDKIKLQLEISNTATEYTPYGGLTVIPSADGTVEGVTSIVPVMTLLTDNKGVTIKAEYNKDTNKVIEQLTNAIISLGGNV